MPAARLVCRTSTRTAAWLAAWLAARLAKTLINYCDKIVVALLFDLRFTEFLGLFLTNNFDWSCSRCMGLWVN